MISLCVPTPVYPVITMRCETCGGNGKIGHRAVSKGPYVIVPCPECNGSGTGYCCEGADLEAATLVQPKAKTDG